ncbi:MAG: peroxidase-related enzyme [Burkholderiales bacterium]
MPFFSSLPADAGVRHILQLNRSAGRPLIELHQALLRGDSPLAPAQLELIAAYVSALNACEYCYGVHAETARAFGLAEDVLEALLADPGSAPVEPGMRPLLAYAKKLTVSPARMTQADADAVFAAGWSERALHDAVLTVCLFNFMNRLLEGHGCKGTAEIHAARGKALRDEGYAPLLELMR